MFLNGIEVHRVGACHQRLSKNKLQSNTRRWLCIKALQKDSTNQFERYTQASEAKGIKVSWERYHLAVLFIDRQVPLQTLSQLGWGCKAVGGCGVGRRGSHSKRSGDKDGRKKKGMRLFTALSLDGEYHRCSQIPGIMFCLNLTLPNFLEIAAALLRQLYTLKHTHHLIAQSER